MSEHERNASQRTVEDEAPPFLGAWPRVYAFVLVYLACVIAVFYWFTRTFAPVDAVLPK